MILPDVNLLVYAYNSSTRQHAAAKLWWETALTDGLPVGLSWAVILGFIRLTTGRRVMLSPITIRQARGIVNSWLERPNVQIVMPGEKHPDLVFDLLDSAGGGGDLTTGAHLAALALEYLAIVATADADFSRFPGVRTVNPLAPRRR